ncbi:class I SAM-dependent methyltransferase [Streptomyces pathocidini]|uniref:class I SAM-dependent DNA methyltransferase n=1 Tax=Streptomyces pathocidini TaxID=1650571 RepID=UPI0033D1EA84
MVEGDYLSETRTSYDAVAGDYAAWARGELEAKPLEAGLLGGFAGLVKGSGGGTVADVGCGTGRVTAHLHGLGLSVFGVDLSPGMVAAARREHPGLRFEEGAMGALDLPDGGLAGLVAWYSTIHVPDGELPYVFAEFHRVLAPGGHVVLAFQVGDEPPLHLTEALGHDVSLVFRRRRPDQVAELLGRAGLDVRARLLRERDEDGEFPERTPQAFLIARKSA